MKRSEIRRSRKRIKRSEVKRSGELKPPRPKRKLFDDRDLRAAWHEHVIYSAPKVGEYLVCSACSFPPSHSNTLQAHHVTEQQAIKDHVKALKLSKRAVAELLAVLLWDIRNGLAVCERCHSRHTLAVERLSIELVTEEHREFARELNLERLIEALYAPVPLRGAA